MNKKVSLLLMGIIVLSCGLLVATTSKATGKSFAGVVPFATSGDRFGFFDQNDGKIYLYDSNISQCVFRGQLEDLGKPIQAVDVTQDESSTNKDEPPTNAVAP